MGRELLEVRDSLGAQIARPVRGVGRSILANITPSGTRHIHEDRLGSVVAETGDAGAVLHALTYDPHGKTRNESGTSDLELTFTGHLRDIDTGLYYMKARWYDPELGTFLSDDPQSYDPADPFSYAEYVYANLNPLTYVDPFGEAAIDDAVNAISNYFGGEDVFDVENGDTLGAGVAQLRAKAEAYVIEETASATGEPSLGAKAILFGVALASDVAEDAEGIARFGEGTERAAEIAAELSTSENQSGEKVTKDVAEAAGGIAQDLLRLLGPLGRLARKGSKVAGVIDDAADLAAKAKKSKKILNALDDAGEFGAKAKKAVPGKRASSFTPANGIKKKASGRAGRQQRLRELADDPSVSSADRGWIRQEMNQIERGKRKSIRNPPGKQLAHPRGREAAKGFSHTEAPSELQDADLHKLQHKYDDFGRRNPREGDLE